MNCKTCDGLGYFISPETGDYSCDCEDCGGTGDASNHHPFDITPDDVIGTLETLVDIIGDGFDASNPDHVRDLVQCIDVQVRAVVEKSKPEAATC